MNEFFYYDFTAWWQMALAQDYFNRLQFSHPDLAGFPGAMGLGQMGAPPTSTSNSRSSGGGGNESKGSGKGGRGNKKSNSNNSGSTGHHHSSSSSVSGLGGAGGMIPGVSGFPSVHQLPMGVSSASSMGSMSTTPTTPISSSSSSYKVRGKSKVVCTNFYLIFIIIILIIN